MEYPFTPLDSLLDEGKEHPIFLLSAVEESTDVARPLEPGACQPYGILLLIHRTPPI
jgi:hypothetical protein